MPDKRIFLRLSYLPVFISWCAFACQEIKECQLETSSDYAWVKMYEADSASKTLKQEVAFDSVYTTGQFVNTFQERFIVTTIADTIEDDTTNVFPVFLYNGGTEITYRFDTDSTDYDLTVRYIPHLRIYDPECDPVYSYKLDTAFSDTFDSVAVVNRVLDMEFSDNVEIYF